MSFRRRDETGDARQQASDGSVNVAVTGTLSGGVVVHAKDTLADTRLTDALRVTYLNRVLAQHRPLDLDILTPAEQDEHRRLELRSVFVEQDVRAEVPVVDLPKELLRRLIELGELGEKDLPDHLDRDRLNRAGQMMRQPAVPVLQVIADSGKRRIALLGDPGAGKSSMARYVAVSLAGPDPVDGRLASLAGWLPVLVELRLFAEDRRPDSTFLGFLDHLFRTQNLGLPEPVLERYLVDDGRAVVIFDGLDEIFDPARRERVAREIAGFADKYPRVKVVVTSRPYGYSRHTIQAAGFAHYTLQDLTQEQIASFVTVWYGLACPDAAEADGRGQRLMQALENSPSIRELAANPMLLTILAIIGRRQDLPRDRRRLYRHAAEVLVEHWDVQRHLSVADVDIGDIDRDDKLEMLELVARRMQGSESGLAGNHIPEKELVAELAGYLSERFEISPARARSAGKTILAKFRERNFILSYFGAGVYGFVHRAFLEYFSAADIDRQFSQTRELSPGRLVNEVFGRRAADPAWQEVLLLLAGMIDERFTGQVVSMLSRVNVAPSLASDRSPKRLVLAAQCVGEVRKLGAVARQASMLLRVPIIGLMTVDQDLLQADLRASRHFMGSFFFNRTLRDGFAAALRATNGNWPGREFFLRWYAVKGRYLGGSWLLLSGTEAATAVSGALYPADENVRSLLVAVVRFGSSRDSRCYAVAALADGRAEDPGVLLLLRDRATTDHEPAVRAAAATALASGWAKDPGTLPLLRNLAVMDVDRDVRQAAVEALASGWAKEPEILPLIRDRAVADPDKWVRRTAVRSLADGWAEDTGTLPLLRAQAVSDPHGEARQAAVEGVASGWVKEPDTLSLLRDRAIMDLAYDVRVSAVDALAAGGAKDPGTLSQLRERVITDPDNWVRGSALRALVAGWPDDPATPATVRDHAIGDPDGWVRQTAVEALAEKWADDPDTFPLLRNRATRDQDIDVRTAAAMAISKIGAQCPEAHAWLRGQVSAGPNTAVRMAAVEAIAAGWPEDPGTFSLLLNCAADDRDAGVRASAIESMIGVCALADGVDLVAWLRDRCGTEPSADVRVVIVRALAVGGLDAASTVALLHHKALTDVSVAVRWTALWSLTVGWPGASEALTLLRDDLTRDRSGEIRAAALEALAVAWAQEPDVRSSVRHYAVNDPDEKVRRTGVRVLAVSWPDEPGPRRLCMTVRSAISTNRFGWPR